MLQADSILAAPYRRRLLAKVLQEAEKWLELKSLLASPENDIELAMLILAAERSGNTTGVDEVLNAGEASGKFSEQLVVQLQRRLEARSRLKR